MIVTFLARITPACKEVTALASESMDRRLPLSTRITLQLHYWICDACARYRNQLLLIRRSLNTSAQPDGPSTPPADSKRQLVEAFKAKHR